jgi:hypothetical protein
MNRVIEQVIYSLGAMADVDVDEYPDRASLLRACAAILREELARIASITGDSDLADAVRTAIRIEAEIDFLPNAVRACAGGDSLMVQASADGVEKAFIAVMRRLGA